MYRPKHRALVRRRATSKRVSVATIGSVSLAVAAVFGPSAYAGTHPPRGHHGDSVFGAPGQGSPAGHGKPSKPGRPDDHNDPAEDDTGTVQHGAATNGGHALPGDSGLSLASLAPTAQPVTP